MIYFSADLHLHHANIMKFCPLTRPYDTVEEMNRDLIDSWNAVVRDQDEVYFLGDFSFSKDKTQVESAFISLRGKKHLIIGNHDYKLTQQLPWHSVQYYQELKYAGRQFVLFHYPIASWKNAIHGSIHLYGHVHAKPTPGMGGNSLDVGVDNIGPTPVSINEILERFKKDPNHSLDKDSVEGR